MIRRFEKWLFTNDRHLVVLVLLILFTGLVLDQLLFG